MKTTVRHHSPRVGRVVLDYQPESWDGVAVVLQRSLARHNSFVTVSIETPRKPRTTGWKSQNNHIHGHAQQLAEFTGYEVGELLAWTKLRAERRSYPVRTLPDGTRIPASQATIDTVQAGYLIDELHQIAAELSVRLIEDGED